MILTASLDSRTNSDPGSGQGLDSETTSDGCSGLYIPLLDAPHVAPLLIPQWRRPARRDRGTVLHDVTLTPLPISTKICPREPKIADYSNTYNSVISIPFSDFVNAYYGPLSKLSNEFRFTLATATSEKLSNCLQV
jgi:hypothetical protein